jgi:hypothetical protein
MKVNRRIQAAVALAVTAGLLFVGMGASAGAQDDPQVVNGDNIQITTTPIEYDGECMTRQEALSYTTEVTAQYFSLIITVAGDLCVPISNVQAVIYRMPGKGVAWPQTLVEQLGVPKDDPLPAIGGTIKDASTIEVRFTKTCDPVQFDVITGGTPDVIGDPTKLPLPPFHGPLLFPTEVGTALQFWGLKSNDCGTLRYQFLGPVCVQDLPYIRWEIAAQGIQPVPTTATITIKDKNGNVVFGPVQRPLQGEVLWPGASESPRDWPGWKLVNGHWEVDPTDQVLREDLTVVAEVNPTASGTVAYPAATAACASPTQFTTTTTTTTTTVPGQTTTTLIGDPTTTGTGGGGGTDASTSSGVPLSVAG